MQIESESDIIRNSNFQSQQARNSRSVVLNKSNVEGLKTVRKLKFMSLIILKLITAVATLNFIHYYFGYIHISILAVHVYLSI